MKKMKRNVVNIVVLIICCVFIITNETVEAKKISIRVGDTYQIKLGKNSKIVSRSFKIIKISKKGKIRALKNGKCTVKVKKGKKVVRYNIVVKKKAIVSKKVSVTQLPSTTQELTTSQEVPVTQETLTIQEVLATQKPSVTQKPSETDIPMATEIPYYLLRPGNPEPTGQPTVTDEPTSQNKPRPTVPPYQSGAYDDMNEGLPMPGGLVMFPGYTIESIVPKTVDTSVVRMVGNTDSLMYISTKYLEIECNNSKLSDLKVGDSVMIGCNINKFAVIVNDELNTSYTDESHISGIYKR